MAQNNNHTNHSELEKLALIAKLTDNSVVLINSQGNIEWANQGFTRMYGYTVEEYKDRYLKDASEAIKTIHHTDKQFFVENRSVSYITHCLTKSGAFKWIQTTLTPVIDANNNIERYIAIETDITRQKEVEEELRQRNENTLTLTEHIENVVSYVEEQRRELDEQKQAVEEAKKRTENVLSQILPYEVAVQLKNKGYAQPRHYKKVSVMFIGIDNFEQLAEQYPLNELVDTLHTIYSEFDEVIETHFIEKIKTLHGAYLCAGGVPLRNKSNPIDVSMASLKIREAVKRLNSFYREEGKPEWHLSIGIHTGEVIAGIVGKRKLSYDIWGDAVQIAVEIQKYSKPGQIFLSQSTFDAIKEYFSCTPDETIQVKNNQLQLYKLNRIIPNYSASQEGFTANQEFLTMISKI